MPDILRALERDRFLERLLARDPSPWSNNAAVQKSIRGRLGWVDAHEKMLERSRELKEFAAAVRDSGYKDVVLLGMGGSSLAPEVFSRTFGEVERFPRLRVLDTTDPASIIAVDEAIDPLRTLFIVSSKSGTTVETMSLYRYFADRVRRASGGERVVDNFVAITDADTTLEKQAREQRFWRVFLNDPEIGGRFSALSYFGLIPAAATGVDVIRVLERVADLNPNEGVELGARLAELAGAGADKVTFIPHPRLAGFGVWAEQLLAESTGKEGKGLIPVDGEPPGAPSVYGDDRVFVRLRLAGETDGLDSGVRALQAAGHAVITLELKDEYDLGAEFLRWEIATAAAGAAMQINPFDEPNVQESKDNTTAVLQDALRGGRLADPEPTATDGGIRLYAPDSLREAAAGGGALFDAIRAGLGKPGDYIAIMAYIQQTPEHDEAFTRLRVALRDSTKLATTLGYGPRFLHSTGQLHKGGPDKGVFLQVVAEDPQDVEVPGESLFTFSRLKRAQALGDLQALESRGRRVVRLDLGADIAGGLQRLAAAAESVAAAAGGARRD